MIGHTTASPTTARARWGRILGEGESGEGAGTCRLLSKKRQERARTTSLRGLFRRSKALFCAHEVPDCGKSSKRPRLRYGEIRDRRQIVHGTRTSMTHSSPGRRRSYPSDVEPLHCRRRRCDGSHPTLRSASHSESRVGWPGRRSHSHSSQYDFSCLHELGSNTGFPSDRWVNEFAGSICAAFFDRLSLQAPFGPARRESELSSKMFD